MVSSIVSASDPFQVLQNDLGRRAAVTYWVSVHFPNCEHLAVSDSIFEGEVGTAVRCTFDSSQRANNSFDADADGRARGRAVMTPIN